MKTFTGTSHDLAAALEAALRRYHPRKVLINLLTGSSKRLADSAEESLEA